VVLLPISSLKQMSYKAKAAAGSRQLPFLTTANPVEPSLEDMNLNYGKIKYYSFDTDQWSASQSQPSTNHSP